MGINRTGGKQQKKFKNNNGFGRKRDPTYKNPEDIDRFYGYVIDSLGDCRFRILCDDNVHRVCKLPNGLKNKHQIEKYMLCLVDLIDGERDKGFIEEVYLDDERNEIINDRKGILNIDMKNDTLINPADDNILVDSGGTTAETVDEIDINDI